jgi:hypothetical protein
MQSYFVARVALGGRIMRPACLPNTNPKPAPSLGGFWDSNVPAMPPGISKLIHHCKLVGKEQHMRQFLPPAQRDRQL